jgi:uncharacterized protein involved in exopolysaccharide biosynthesis
MTSSELERLNAPPELEGVYPSEPEAELHLRDYLYVILKRRWLVVAITITALLISAVWTLRQTPVYTATALVQISRGKLDPIRGVTTYDVWVDYTEFYPTQENILRSYNMAYRVVESLRLWEHPFFNRGAEGRDPGPKELKGLARAVLSMLSVSQMKQTQLMQVSFTTPDPEVSALLANALVRQYVSFNSKTETEIAQDTVTFLSDQIERLEQEIREKEKLLRDYSRRDDIILMDQKEDIVFEQLKDLNQQASKARGELAAAEARYRGLEGADPSSLDDVQRNSKIVDLERRRAQLQEEVEKLSSKFESDWPELQRAREALEQVERRLGEETSDVAQKVVAVARIDYEAVRERERLLQQAHRGLQTDPIRAREQTGGSRSASPAAFRNGNECREGRGHGQCSPGGRGPRSRSSFRPQPSPQPDDGRPDRFMFGDWSRFLPGLLGYIHPHR